MPTTDQPAFLTGVARGWHAIPAANMAYGATTAGGKLTVAVAACGELVRAAPKFGAYIRGAQPVAYQPCHPCAWQVAAAAGQLDAEVQRLVPIGDAAALMACCLVDPLIAATTAGRILAGARSEDGDGADDPAALQLLAAVSAHAPVLLYTEGCAEGDHDHDGEPCPVSAACAACSLQAGDWAGEWAGRYRSECRIDAPCAPLQALAAHAATLDLMPRDETADAAVLAAAQAHARREG